MFAWSYFDGSGLPWGIRGAVKFAIIVGAYYWFYVKTYRFCNEFLFEVNRKAKGPSGVRVCWFNLSEYRNAF